MTGALADLIGRPADAHTAGVAAVSQQSGKQLGAVMAQPLRHRLQRGVRPRRQPGTGLMGQRAALSPPRVTGPLDGLLRALQPRAGLPDQRGGAAPLLAGVGASLTVRRVLRGPADDGKLSVTACHPPP